MTNAVATPIDLFKSRAIWDKYQSEHDVSDRLGQAVGIDPVSERIWFGNKALDVARQMRAEVDDIVTIDGNYTMGGAFNFGKFDIKTEYGNLSIPKEKIKSVDVTVISAPGSGDFTFKLLGSKNISGNHARCSTCIG